MGAVSEKGNKTMAAPKSVIISSDLFRSVSSVFYLMRTFGFLPLVVSKINSTTFGLKWSWKLSLYGYFFITLWICLTMAGLYHELGIDVVYETKMKNVSKYVTVAEYGLISFIGIMGVILTNRHIEYLCQFFHCINQVDAALDQDKTERRSKPILRTALLGSVFHWIIMTSDLCMWRQATKNDQSFISLVMCQLPSYMTYYNVTLVEIFYYSMISTLNSRVERFVASIECLPINTEGNFENIVDIHGKLTKVQSSFFGETVKMDGLPKPQTGKKLFILGLSSASVYHLTRTHELIICSVRFINQFFGAVILVVILSCVMHLVVTPYVLYSMLDSTDSNLFLISQSFWMVGHISRLALIVEPCHDCLSKMDHAKFLICKRVSLEIDEAIRRKVSGIVVTYLVILFQLKLQGSNIF